MDNLDVITPEVPSEEETQPATPIQLGYFESLMKSKYDYLEIKDIVNIVNKAKLIFFTTKYPCEPWVDETTRPITSFVDKSWISMCCDELVDRLGFSSAIAYKENGVSWTFDNAQVSDRLISLIKPIIGVV